MGFSSEKDLVQSKRARPFFYVLFAAVAACVSFVGHPLANVSFRPILCVPLGYSRSDVIESFFKALAIFFLGFIVYRNDSG